MWFNFCCVVTFYIVLPAAAADTPPASTAPALWPALPAPTTGAFHSQKIRTPSAETDSLQYSAGLSRSPPTSPLLQPIFSGSSIPMRGVAGLSLAFGLSQGICSNAGPSGAPSAGNSNTHRLDAGDGQWMWKWERSRMAGHNGT